MHGYGFLGRCFTDQREFFLHGGSVTSQTGFLLFRGIAPGMVEFWASTGRSAAGYACCWSTCIYLSTFRQLHIFHVAMNSQTALTARSVSEIFIFVDLVIANSKASRHSARDCHVTWPIALPGPICACATSISGRRIVRRLMSCRRLWIGRCVRRWRIAC